MKRSGYIQRFITFRRRNKFGAVPVHNTVTGESFDSRGESRRIGALRVMERAGIISNLVVHPTVVLIERTDKAPQIAYRPDASYMQEGRTVWEDFKPRPQTPRETMIFKLWQHFGPGVLLITGSKGETKKTIMGARQ
jgi:hypothetical protein